MLAGSEQHDEQHNSVSRWLFIAGASGSAIGVIVPISYSVLYMLPSLYTGLWMWLNMILWPFWYFLLGFGFFALHQRYGRAFPLWISLLSFITAALGVVIVTVVYSSPEWNPWLLQLFQCVTDYRYLGMVTTLALGGYAFRQIRDQSRNRRLMEITGTALIVGGIAIVLPVIMITASVASLLTFLLFVKE